MENNFVDTSNADFASQFKAPEMEYGDDFFGDEDLNEIDNPEEENFDDNADSDSFDDNADSDENVTSTGNVILDNYIQWAEERGIDPTKQGIDPKTFDESQMDKLVGEYYIQKRLGGVDPRIHELAENGVSLDDYIEHKNYLQSIAQQDPVQLYKASMYDHLLKTESQIGSISLDKNGNPDQKSVEYLVSEVERRIQQMDPEAVKQRGIHIQNAYKQQISELPDHLIKQQQDKYKSELQRYNTEVEELTNLYKERLSKIDNLVIDFSGQAEKDEFINYMKNSLEIQNFNGQQVVPLLHRLQNDADFLATTVRLLHMHEKGYFTDMKNMERNAAFKKLSVTPVLGTNSKNQSTGGAGKFVDTSDPNYIKKFKR